jgi:hypothetical protein
MTATSTSWSTSPGIGLYVTEYVIGQYSPARREANRRFFALCWRTRSRSRRRVPDAVRHGSLTLKNSFEGTILTGAWRRVQKSGLLCLLLPLMRK